MDNVTIPRFMRIAINIHAGSLYFIIPLLFFHLCYAVLDAVFLSNYVYDFYDKFSLVSVVITWGFFITTLFMRKKFYITSKKKELS
jgi:hypothetical protein